MIAACSAAGRDHRERAGARERGAGVRGGLVDAVDPVASATNSGCSPVLRTDRDGSTVGRGDREQAGRNVHDLGRRAVVDRRA